jgi:transposase InsO family protein
MSERLKFVTLVEEEAESMAALCRRFGISRKTGYAVLARYRTCGADGLRDRPHTAHHHPHAVADALEQRIVLLRGEHPSWGPRKLRARLQRIEPQTLWPAASTIGDILQRHGLIVPRRRRRPVTPADLLPFASCEAANDSWCIDFKGWFRTGDGRRCDPLTISDAHSRFLLRCQAVLRPDTRSVRPLLEATFREYGLPRAIRSDNGPPFASPSVAGLSQLSVWWIKLGIRPERITPGRPCENGRHERMHGTLEKEACRPPAPSRRAQQKRFDTFRRIYNEERPHEAIANATPSMLYRSSPRTYPARLPELVYPDHWQVRMVRQKGAIKWRGDHLFISEVLAGEPIGLEETDHGWDLYFGPVRLGTLNQAGRFQRAGMPRRRGALRSAMAPRAAPEN